MLVTRTEGCDAPLHAHVDVSSLLVKCHITHGDAEETSERFDVLDRERKLHVQPRCHRKCRVETVARQCLPGEADT